MPFDDHTPNFAYSLVATAPSPATTGTSLVVTAGQGSKFPTPPFNATIWPVSTQPLTTNAEIVRVTAISTDTLTIKRAQESSSARTVIIGDQIAATVTAKTLTDVEAGFSPDLALSANQSPRDNTIPANFTAFVADAYECGAAYGPSGTGSNSASVTAGWVFAVPATIPYGFTPNRITVIAGIANPGFLAAGTGNMRVAIYADSGGTPGALLYQPAAQAYAATDRLAQFTLSTTELAAGTVWVAIQVDTSATDVALVSGGLGVLDNTGSYGAGFTDPFAVGPQTGQNSFLLTVAGLNATEIGAGALLEIG